MISVQLLLLQYYDWWQFCKAVVKQYGVAPRVPPLLNGAQLRLGDASLYLLMASASPPPILLQYSRCVAIMQYHNCSTGPTAGSVVLHGGHPVQDICWGLLHPSKPPIDHSPSPGTYPQVPHIITQAPPPPKQPILAP